MPRPRPYCCELSQANGESLGATASRIDHWLLLEYRGRWARDALDASLLPDAVKEQLRGLVRRVPRARLLFVRRPERRSRRGFSVVYGRTSERDPWFRSFEVEAYDDLPAHDLVGAFEHPNGLGEPVEHPLLVVCTHGKRDPCCARQGRPLYEGLQEAADEGWVWQSSHIGGDRFAGNLVCLPEGVYYGRVSRLDALGVLAEHLAGRIDLEHYRGRCCYSFPVQAAERAARERSSVLGIDDVRVESTERLGDSTWRVRLRAGSTRYQVDVAAEQGELTLLTCSSPTAKSPRRYVARSVEILPGPAS